MEFTFLMKKNSNLFWFYKIISLFWKECKKHFCWCSKTVNAPVYPKCVIFGEYWNFSLQCIDLKPLEITKNDTRISV